MKTPILLLSFAVGLASSAFAQTMALKDGSNVDAATWRTKLDVPATADVATYEQGALADTALQPGGSATFTSMTTSTFTVKGYPLSSVLAQNTWTPAFGSWSLSTGGTAYAAQLKMLTSGVADNTVSARTTPSSSDAHPLLQLGGARNAIDFSKEVWASWRFNVFTNNATCVFRGWVGQYHDTMADPAHNGFGFEVTNLGLKLMAYKVGTGMTRSASNIATLTANVNYRLVVRKAADGAMTAWINIDPDQTPTATLSNGPVATPTDSAFIFLLTNGTTETAVRAHCAVPTLFVNY